MTSDPRSADPADLSDPADAADLGDLDPDQLAARTARATRDRDAAGRARSARPRDALGRPLPRGAAGVPTVPDDLALDADTALAMAQDYLDRELPFQAHEVLEAMWKQADEPERNLWQGLAQIAVGMTHVRRGNHAGGVRLLRRGSRRLDSYAGTTPHRIDVDGVMRTVAEAAAAIEVGETAAPLLHLRRGG